MRAKKSHSLHKVRCPQWNMIKIIYIVIASRFLSDAVDRLSCTCSSNALTSYSYGSDSRLCVSAHVENQMSIVGFNWVHQERTEHQMTAYIFEECPLGCKNILTVNRSYHGSHFTLTTFCVEFTCSSNAQVIRKEQVEDIAPLSKHFIFRTVYGWGLGG